MSPATPDQLKTLTRIIYGILNRRNGRWYIGQTLHSFHLRYVNGKWWEHTTNTPLRNAYNRYGSESFEVYIFESGIELEAQLDELEKQYVASYDAIFPRGYNFENGGQQYGKRINPSTRSKMSKAHMRHYARERVLLDEREQECRFMNITEFALQRGLDPKMVSNLLRGSPARYRGFHLPGTNLAKFHRDSELKKIIGPDGREYEFYNAAEFCRQHGLCHASFVKMLGGQQANHNGYYLASNPKRPIGYRWGNEANRNKRYERIILERDGQQYVITNDIRDFCCKYSLNKRDVYALTAADQKTAHGFRLVRVEYTATYLAKHPELIST